MLIPVHHALSKIERYMEEHPDENEAPDQDEIQRMARLLLDYCWEDVALRLYGNVLGGKPSPN
jgi:hypothetical protein